MPAITRRIKIVSTHSILALILCAGLIGCQSTASIRDNPTQSKPDVEVSPATSGLDTARAGTSLRKRAKIETDTGQYQRASRLLERALRVDSRDPATFYEFARLRCLEASPERAAQLIEKGLTLKPDGPLRSLFTALKAECSQLAS